jgi:hypothetical protein
MKTIKLVKFLLDNYEPDENLCWQTWCKEDFKELNVSDSEWQLAVDNYSQIETDERESIEMCILDARKIIESEEG